MSDVIEPRGNFRESAYYLAITAERRAADKKPMDEADRELLRETAVYLSEALRRARWGGER